MKDTTRLTLENFRGTLIDIKRSMDNAARYQGGHDKLTQAGALIESLEQEIWEDLKNN